MSKILIIAITLVTGTFLALPIVNISINFLLGIDAVVSILNIVAFVLPWNNIMPLISLIIAFFVFRIAVSLIKTIWELIPIA